MIVGVFPNLKFMHTQEVVIASYLGTTEPNRFQSSFRRSIFHSRKQVGNFGCLFANILESIYQELWDDLLNEEEEREKEEVEKKNERKRKWRRKREEEKEDDDDDEGEREEQEEEEEELTVKRKRKKGRRSRKYRQNSQLH